MLELDEVNAFDPEMFTVRIRPVFEHSPWVAARTAAARPFATREELHAALCRTVSKASEAEKLALIRAHPDLVGRAVLTHESQAEQKSAGLDHLSAEEIERFTDFNQRYREKFGFPFVICARRKQEGGHSGGPSGAAAESARTRDQNGVGGNLPNRRTAAARSDSMSDGGVFWLARASRVLVRRVPRRRTFILFPPTEVESSSRREAGAQMSLTTHVLDTRNGRPAPGMKIELWSVEPRELLQSVTTNSDGRTDQLLFS